MSFLPGCCAPKKAAPVAGDDADEPCCVPLVQGRLEAIEVQADGTVIKASGEEEKLSELDLSEDASIRKAQEYILQAMEFHQNDLVDKAVMRLQFALSILEFVPQHAPTTMRLQQVCLQDQELQSILVELAKTGRVKISTLHDVCILRDTLMVKEQRREERKSSRIRASHSHINSIVRASNAGKEDENESEESSGVSDLELADFGGSRGTDRRLSLAECDLAAGRQTVKTEEDKMKEVLEQCKSGRYLDAYGSLKELIESSQRREKIEEECVAQLRLLGGQTSKVGALNVFLKDPVVCNLERVRGHIQRALNREKVLAVRDGAGWSHIQVGNPYLHADYNCQLWVRQAKGKERHEAGPPTQLLWSAKHENVPLRLKDLVSIYREIDLFKKDWIPRCKYFEGTKAGPQQLDCMFINYYSSEVSFVYHEETVAQYMFVWPEASSVVIVGISPPADARMFEGFRTKPHKNGSPFIPDSTSTTYLTPHSTNPGMCNITMTGTRGFRFPEWMLNVAMLKHFMARNQILLIHNMLEGWSVQQGAYDKRTKGTADAKFYAQVSNLSLTRSHGSWLLSESVTLDNGAG